MAVKHVEGSNKKHNVFLYALSTCVWCKKTRSLLEEMGACYDYEYVDLLVGEERDKVMREVEIFNPSGGFPTIVINKEQAIVGFKPEEIKAALE
ncbi:MAG: glutaredoxin family protein [Endomicrobia bacterium]|nr:glutaredoxin family protein [Endomicrobiia bacterium]